MLRRLRVVVAVPYKASLLAGGRGVSRADDDDGAARLKDLCRIEDLFPQEAIVCRRPEAPWLGS